jgi:hypothetical protein
MLICCERKTLFHDWLILADKLKQTEPYPELDGALGGSGALIELQQIGMLYGQVEVGVRGSELLATHTGRRRPQLATVQGRVGDRPWPSAGGFYQYSMRSHSPISRVLLPPSPFKCRPGNVFMRETWISSDILRDRGSTLNLTPFVPRIPFVPCVYETLCSPIWPYFF